MTDDSEQTVEGGGLGRGHSVIAVKEQTKVIGYVHTALNSSAASPSKASDGPHATPDLPLVDMLDFPPQLPPIVLPSLLDFKVKFPL